MDFVDFNLSKKLKEKGFRELCLAYYTTEYTIYNNVITLTDDKYLCVLDIDYEEFLVSHNSIKYTNGNYVDAPTISQVLKWLREDKQIHVGIIFTGKDYTTWIQPLNNIDTQITIHDCDNNNEAAIAGIEYVLNNLI